MNYMVKHKYITVNSDQKKEAKFTGDLHDFACQKLNEWIMDYEPASRIINIESHSWRDEIRPKQCDSSTWYDRFSVRLSVWYEVGGQNI